MTQCLRISPAEHPLRGELLVPSDKSVSHRALMFAALARGTSRLTRCAYGEDNQNTLLALRTLGVDIEDDGQGTVTIRGVGLSGLRAAGHSLDCGNSGTTMRLMTGLLAACPFSTTLIGDASLSRRPMSRVAVPLRARGATIEGRAHPSKPHEITAPLVVGPLLGSERLRATRYEMQVASAQVKSALLLSGLNADGPTVITEPTRSRDHTERMLQALGARLTTWETGVELTPLASPDALPAFALELFGDLSAAAFPLAAAALVEGSCVTVKDAGTNPTRTGFLDVLRLWGGDLEVGSQQPRLGEPVANITLQHRLLRGRAVGGELAVRSIDEIPILCAIAARSEGVTTLTDLSELRVKESDRIKCMVRVLRAFGVECEEHEQGLTIQGNPHGRLRAATIASEGDHRIAMTGAVLALVADGPSVIEDVACVATSFPTFGSTLRHLGVHLQELP